MEKSETKRITLCDGCILIVMIGVAALVFTPGITQAVEGKKISEMVDSLQTVRSQIMLYQAHHDGLLPGQNAGGDAVTAEAFVLALKQQKPDGSGPYLHQIPRNPYLAEFAWASKVACVNDAAARPTGCEGCGWWFNAATGDFFACDSASHTGY